MSMKLTRMTALLLVLAIACDNDEAPDVFQPPRIEEVDPEMPITCDENHPDYKEWFIDEDGDGYGTDIWPSEFFCTEEVKGFSRRLGDCNDLSASVSPGAKEIWYDGIDQDCYGGDDYDQDNDGERPPQLDDWVGNYPVEWGKDCNDAMFWVNSSHLEMPDGLDNDCDGMIDNSRTGRWYCDFDTDGHAGSEIWFVAGHPGTEEFIYGEDRFCSMTQYKDHPSDCDDEDYAINPDAHERLNGLDDNCDGRIDEHARRMPKR